LKAAIFKFDWLKRKRNYSSFRIWYSGKLRCLVGADPCVCPSRGTCNVHRQRANTCICPNPI